MSGNSHFSQSPPTWVGGTAAEALTEGRLLHGREPLLTPAGAALFTWPSCLLSVVRVLSAPLPRRKAQCSSKRKHGCVCESSGAGWSRHQAKQPTVVRSGPSPPPSWRRIGSENPILPSVILFPSRRENGDDVEVPLY